VNDSAQGQGAPRHELAPGTPVGEYRVERRLAAGGMGTVYQALHPVIGKRAAIKVLHPELALAPHLVQRFVDEARAVNHIRHPHIVDIFAFGNLPDGRHYFVMEWLEGESLSAQQARGALSVLAAIDVVLQLCDALSAAHQKGIIHRDLKPDNVFLTAPGGRTGFVKLLDFGIAKLSHLPTDAATSMPGLIVGTPDYIAPEQAQGDETGPPADVYALGVVAYELFLGRRPFSGASPFEVIAQHLNKAPPPPAELWREVPPALAKLLVQMLAKNPAERPKIQEVRAAFEEIRAAATLESLELSVDARFSGRPVVRRRFDSIPALVHTLWRELGAGAGWVTTQGEVPPAGTPAIVRFVVPRLGLELDLGAVLGGALGGEGARALLRYDRLPKPELDRLTELVAASASLPGNREANEPLSTFEAPQPRQRPYRREPPAAVSTGATRSWSSGLLPAQAAATPPTPARSRPRAGPRPSERLKELVVAPDADRSRLGLGARILAISAAIVVLAVVSVAYLALRQAEEDRRFYLQDLNLRTARAGALALRQRLEAAEAELSLFAPAAAIEAVGAWTRVTVCKPTCRSLAGPTLPDDRLAKIKSELQAGRLFLESMGTEVLIASGGPGAWVVGTLPADELMLAAELAPDLSTAVWHKAHGPLATRPPQLAAELAQHAIITSLGVGSTAAITYQDPAGKTVLGAFATADELAFLVLAPATVGSEQNAVLARQVTVVAIVVLLLAVVVTLVFARAITSRLRRLADHAARIARGDFAEPPEVSGRDEIGLLARSFEGMTRSLKERDTQVLTAQRKMSEVESRAVQRHVSEWLERDLAEKLQGIRQTLSAPQSSWEVSRTQLLGLAEQAGQSLQSAMMFAALGGARVDLHQVVAEAVAFTQSRGPRPDVDLRLEAPNAVLFPRLDAPESVARELTLALLGAAVNSAPADGLVDVNLNFVDGALALDVVLESPGAAERLQGVLHDLQATLQAVGATAQLDRPAGLVRARVLFHLPEAG
jgi:HAMP domain-containing protein/tRNA A-37 threonylcarbamoyl transferase component Bud32